MTQRNDFFNVNLNARLGSGLQFGGGVDTGHTINDVCFNVDSPGAAAATPRRFCHAGAVYFHDHQRPTHLPRRHAVQGPDAAEGVRELHLSERHPREPDLPEHLGAQITAAYAAPTSIILPSLGRYLAACGTRTTTCTSTATVPLIAPQTMFEDRYTRFDLRVSKRMQLTQNVRLTGNFNVFNLFNGSAIQVENVNYGSLWLQPSLTEDSRMMQFSGTLTF